MSKRTFFIIITIASILIIATANYFASSYIKQRMLINIDNQHVKEQQVITKEISQILEIEVANLTEKLKLISKIPEIRDGETKECNLKLQQVYESLDQKVGNLARIDQEGLFHCSLNNKIIGQKAASFGTYITDIFEDPQHNPVMSRALVSPGITGLVAAIHVPVYDSENSFIGTMGGAIYFDQIYEKYLKDLELEEGGYVVLLDDDGTILSHPDPGLTGKNVDSPEVAALLTPSTTYQEIMSAALGGEKGSTTYHYNELSKLGVYRSVEIFPDRKWVVLVAVPVNSINKTLIDSRIEELFNQSIFASTVVALLVGGFFLLSMIFSVFNPIGILTNAAEQIGKGNLNTRVDISSNDEMGKLARVFNHMTAQLKISRENLEEKVRMRTRELETANIKLQELDKLKDEFVSVASHELRTPMTAIKGFLSMILEGDYGKVPAKLEAPLQDIYDSAERLIHLVGDMLNVSRIEAGRLKYVQTVFDAKQLVEKVVNILQPIATSKKVILQAQINANLPKVQADEEKVEQILLNLLGNALKFTDTGTITLAASVQGEHVVLSITDTGLGIAPEDQAKLFSKFTQLTSQKAGRPAGTGLGLYISRELAQKMGGELRLESSQPGKGSTFSISVPVANSATANKAQQAIKLEANDHPDQKS